MLLKIMHIIEIIHIDRKILNYTKEYDKRFSIALYFTDDMLNQ